MFRLPVYIGLTGLLLFGGYVVTVFSNAFYIDPDEIKSLFPELSARRKRELERIAASPRAFYQIAYLVRTSAALALGILALLMAQQVAVYRLLPAAALYVALFVAVWSATMIMFIYLPRRVSPGEMRSWLIRFLPLISLLYLISLPFVNLLRWFQLRPGRPEISEEQKDDIVERAIETLAESAGISAPIIEEDEKEMIHGIFQLDVTEVQEVMVPRINIIALPKEATLEMVQTAVRKYGYSRFPVYEGTIDTIIGIIPVKDLLVLPDQQRSDFDLVRHIRRPLQVGARKKIDQLMSEFKKTKTHMAIVVDEFGGTAGIITLEDILEEIVGDIQDEHDPNVQEDIKRLPDGRLEVSGACSLEDLAHALDLELDQEEFETVAGLIYDLVGSIPSEGTSLNWKTARLKVLHVEGQRIKRVLVSPAP